jgi:hypothetical protein
MHGCTLQLLLCLPLAHLAWAQIDCPDAGALGRCFTKYDLDADGMLDLGEFQVAISSVPWYVRWSLEQPSVYFTRCDQDKDGRLTPFELLSSECIPFCAQQRTMYSAMC